jgi:hypothetical protein
LAAAGVIIAQAAILGFWAIRRGVNADEGFYLAASRAVLEGQRLYADVFFPQMPYLPIAEAFLFSLTGVSLDAGRALSVIAGAFGAGLVAAFVWRDERRVDVLLCVALLYAGSGVLLTNLSIVKTYALANLGLLLALFLLTSLGPVGVGRAFVAGMAAAFAIGVRLAVAPAALVLALLALRWGFRSLIAFTCGGALASVPWLISAWQFPEHFWFCNVSFHSLRREMADVGAVVGQKLRVVAKWVFVPQHVVLWSLVAAGFFRAPRRTWPAAACIAVLAVAYAMATPTYLEYTAQFIPFMLIVATPALAWLLRRRIFAGAVVAAYLLAIYPFVRAVADDERIAAKRALWDRKTVAAVVRAVQRETAPGDRILSWWEGYPVLSQRPGFVGVGFWESNVAKKISPADAKRFHVLQRSDLEALVAGRVPRAVVIADGEWDHLRPVLARAGYEPAHRIDAVEIRVPPRDT